MRKLEEQDGAVSWAAQELLSAAGREGLRFGATVMVDAHGRRIGALVYTLDPTFVDVVMGCGQAISEAIEREGIVSDDALAN